MGLVAVGLSSWISAIHYLKPSLIASPPTHLGIDVDTECTLKMTLRGSDCLTLEEDVCGEKVRELAGRGMTIERLLDFYALLGDPEGIMQSFDPYRSTTKDVVHHVVIPLSCKDEAAMNKLLEDRPRSRCSITAPTPAENVEEQIAAHIGRRTVVDIGGRKPFRRNTDGTVYRNVQPVSQPRDQT